MKLGPVTVSECPECGNLLTKGSIMSGNTFGAVVYSDGRCIAPMFEEFPKLTKCRKCNTIVWFNKLKVAGIYQWEFGKNREYENVDRVEFLTIAEYYRALKEGLAENNQEESHIRQRIWWAYNDRIRNGGIFFENEKDEIRWQENCELLMSLLNPSDKNERIMIAEIKRNLGDFKGCMEIIESIDDDKLDWLKIKFKKACENRNRRVIKLRSDK